MKKMLTLVLALAFLAVPAWGQTLFRNADQLALETGQANRYTLLNGPVGFKSPLWLGTAPTGTSLDAWLYMTGDPSGFEYAIYSGSTLPSYFAGGISFTQIPAATLELEGTTANAYETTLTVGDPTADRTVTFADASGTVMLTALATNAADVANSVTGASNGLLFEGATADAYELTLTVTDPATSDKTITLPNVTGTVQLSTLTQLVGTSAPPVACAGGTAGTIYYDSDINKLCVCNATNYVLVDDATTTTGCS